jgi:uncharacterized protein (DUF1330 family)
MKTTYVVALSAAAGIAIGAAAVQTLHAQAKLPGYIVAEIDVSNVEGYTKEFLPVASKALAAGGPIFLARGGKNESIEGAAPPKRVIVSQFDSLEKAVATYKSPADLEARKIGDKYAKFRIFAVEGVAPK